MALIEHRIDGKINKVKTAIDRLKAFESAEGYWLAYSGGKDSVVIKRLAEMAGIKFKAHYSCTSVDPPELVRFIKADKTVSFDIPRDKDGKPITMWNLIVKKKFPPSRTARYCCSELKESQGKGQITVTGVRWAESSNRKNNQNLIKIFGRTKKEGVLLEHDNDENRRTVENCYRLRKTLINPIIDWTDSDVWEFISVEKILYCELYGDIKVFSGNYSCTGDKRLGCIGCPMGNKNGMLNVFERYPKYKENYIKAFDRMLKEKDKPAVNWTCGEDVFDWWVEGISGRKEIKGQIEFEIGEQE